MLPVLDPAQLTRIHATHRGFLYQHVYAVALLLAAPERGTLKVRVERDQDIEIVRGDATLYIQVRTRLDRSLMPSDIAGVLSDFAAIRVAHATGARAGLARFAVVSNATAGPALVREIADWPADVVFVAGDTSESGSLVRAPATVEALLDECVRLAGGYVLSTLRPETLVWKLAAIVSAACANEGPAREFDVDALPALCEMAAAELHALPRVENYLAQRGEPDAAALPRVSMVLGHSGTGKSAWASQAATHGGDVVVYFRCADLPDDQLAPRFVREAVARIAKRRGVPAYRLVLSGASGLESLTALDAALAAQGVSVVGVIDDCHRLSAETIVRAVESTTAIRWILLAQPSESIAASAARLQIEPLTLQGWSDDTIARVLHARECSADPRGVSALRRVTGGAPLFVLHAVGAIARTAERAPLQYVDALRGGTLTSRTPQELVLAASTASVSIRDARVAGSLACVDVQLPAAFWRETLSSPLGIEPRDVGDALRALDIGGFIVKKEGGEVSLHDAFRPLFDFGVLGADTRRTVRRAVAEHLVVGLLESRSAERLLAYFSVRRDLGELQAISELATELAEWIRELGELPAVYSLLNQALAGGRTLSNKERFWAEDTLAFFDVELGDIASADARVTRAAALVESLGDDE